MKKHEIEPINSKLTSIEEKHEVEIMINGKLKRYFVTITEKGEYKYLDKISMNLTRLTSSEKKAVNRYLEKRFIHEAKN